MSTVCLRGPHPGLEYRGAYNTTVIMSCTVPQYSTVRRVLSFADSHQSVNPNFSYLLCPGSYRYQGRIVVVSVYGSF